MKKNFTAKVVTMNILVHEADYHNCKYPFYGVGKQSAADYTFGRRIEYIKAMFRYAHPDVVLMQEVSGPNFWGTELKLQTTECSGMYHSKVFPDFAFVNHGDRRSVLYENNLTTTDAFAAHNFVMFDTRKYRYISSGTRFVSEDGTRESSWNENGKNRLFHDLGDYTWVVLEEKDTKLISIYATIHVYTGGVQRNAYLVQNLQYVTEHLEKISAEYGHAPVVLAGDFNISTGRLNCIYPYQHMTESANYIDSKIAGDDTGTFRCFGENLYGREGATSNGQRMDYIFTNGGRPVNYHVLKGMIKIDQEGHFEYVPEPVFDGSMYDISDHQPVYTEIVIDEDTRLQPADRKNYYRNANTQNDKVIVSSKLPHITVGDKMEADVVEDEIKGRVLRIRATDELNHVAIAIDYKAFTDCIDVTNYQKITITYKTEYSLYGNKIYCHASLDESTLKEGIATSVFDTAGVWKTLSINVNQLTGNLNQIGFIGEHFDTGFLNGDAIYIASIKLD